MACNVPGRILLVSLFSFALEATVQPAQHVVRHAIIGAKRGPDFAVSHSVAQGAKKPSQGEAGAGLGQMLDEIRAVRVVLNARRRAGGWDEEYETMGQQLEELEQMLSALKSKEANDHLAHMNSHKELQSEIDHLEEQMQRLGLQNERTSGPKGEAHGADAGNQHTADDKGAGGVQTHSDLQSVGSGSDGSDGSDITSDEGKAIEAAGAPAEDHPVKDRTGEEAPGASSVSTPDLHKAIDVDMQMPYGDLEPFGREDTAQELTEDSIRQSNEMVDQLERAEVAEEKRSVFRALTRLRGAAITSYDGVARSQTGNIDDYARTNQWRTAHPVHHLANDEADVSKWAFPEDATDF